MSHTSQRDRDDTATATVDGDAASEVRDVRHVSMTVNGRVRAMTVEPRMTLLDALLHGARFAIPRQVARVPNRDVPGAAEGREPEPDATSTRRCHSWSAAGAACIVDRLTCFKGCIFPGSVAASSVNC